MLTVNNDALWLILGSLGVLIFLSVLAGLLKSRRYKYTELPIFTKAEAHFYKSVLLPLEAQSNLKFFAKIRVADIVKPHKTLSKKERSKHFWRTSSKHIDFVAIDKRTLKTIGCIELNDSSHQRKDRIARDKMIEKIMESAEIPMLWVKWQKVYGTEVGDNILNTLNREKKG